MASSARLPSRTLLHLRASPITHPPNSTWHLRTCLTGEPPATMATPSVSFIASANADMETAADWPISTPKLRLIRARTAPRRLLLSVMAQSRIETSTATGAAAPATPSPRPISNHCPRGKISQKALSPSTTSTTASTPYCLPLPPTPSSDSRRYPPRRGSATISSCLTLATMTTASTSTTQSPRSSSRPSNASRARSRALGAAGAGRLTAYTGMSAKRPIVITEVAKATADSPAKYVWENILSATTSPPTTPLCCRPLWTRRTRETPKTVARTCCIRFQYLGRRGIKKSWSSGHEGWFNLSCFSILANLLLDC